MLVAIGLKCRRKKAKTQQISDDELELKARVDRISLDETNEPVSPDKLPSIHRKKTSIVGIIIEDPDEQQSDSVEEEEEESEEEEEEEEMSKPVAAYSDAVPKHRKYNNNSTANASISSITIDRSEIKDRSKTPIRPLSDMEVDKLMPPAALKGLLKGKRNSAIPDFDVNSQAHRNESIATNNHSQDMIEPVRPLTPRKEHFYDSEYKLESDHEMQKKMQKWHMESVEKNQISREKSMISSDDEANITRMMQSRMSDAEDKDRWRRDLKQKTGQTNGQLPVYYDSAGSTNYASNWENWTKKN